MLRCVLEKVIKYFCNIGLALSILLNAVLAGESNQTLSARAFKLRHDYLCKFIDFLFWDKDHCFMAFIRHAAIKSALDNVERFRYNDRRK